ncbi:MAG: efflux RND transporter periplasmic adaptor subunit [Pseudolabrys sp.]|nr:efflux RND transporter periplasmic adaptor subunit [Pseudolabrys sp.]
MNKPIDPKERVDIHAILGEASSTGTAFGVAIKRLLIGVAVVGLLIIAGLWLFGGASSTVTYVTQPVTQGSLTVIVTATGSVQPTNKVDVSSELSGTVRKVFVDYNSEVKAGDVLAELDTDKLRATLNSSRAKLAVAEAKVVEIEATVRQTARDLERHKALLGTHAVSTREHDTALASYERALATLRSANADVDVAKADLELNATNLAKAVIRSPINGVVLTRAVDPGQTVASTLQAPVLFSIAEDLKQMELQVDVDEADVGKVHVGQSATFGVDAFPDRKFPATIRELRYASETIQGVVTYKAILNIDNSELLLRPGMTATAEIRVLEVSDALLVSNAALRYAPPATSARNNRSLLQRILPGPPGFRAPKSRESTGPDRTVWLLRDGTPTPVTVSVGASDGRHTEVKSGELAVGQAVIVDQTTVK